MLCEPARARPGRKGLALDALIASLLIWIGSHSALEVAGLPAPTIVEMTPLEITRQVHRLAGMTLAPTVADTRLFGAYDPHAGEHGTIYVVRAESAPYADEFANHLDNPYFHERLLHELVHHVQFRSGAIDRLPCPAAAERDAYRLAGMFVRERHLRDPLAHRASLLRMLDGC
ncbi:MAG: DUF6647 family protein [Burkholderiaceae bacterium]